MERLTNFGPRPVGSYECDVQAAAYIRQALDTVKLGAGAGVEVEVDTQTASGGFHLPGFEVYQRYQGVTNVVVRLSNASRPRHPGQLPLRQRAPGPRRQVRSAEGGSNIFNLTH